MPHRSEAEKVSRAVLPGEWEHNGAGQGGLEFGQHCLAFEAQRDHCKWF